MSTEKPIYIQLEPDETVISVRDRLSFLRGQSVLIISPEQGTALTRKLDLVLVQREARRQLISFALVTHDEHILQHAKDLGISTFETIKSAEKARWKRGSPRIFTRRYQRPETEPDPEDLIDVASRVRHQRQQSPLKMLILRVVVLIIVSAVLGGTGYLLIPSAEITIYPRSELLQVESTITIDTAVTDIDVESGMIPATILRASVQDVGTIATTGTQQSADTKAAGIVVFSNQTDSSVIVPAGSIVSTGTDGSIQFKTLAEVIIPGGTGQQIEADIEAMPEFSGERGNVAAGVISAVQGELAEQVAVINFSPTTGGESRVFAAVTESDREQLLAQMRAQVQTTAYTQMQENLNPGQELVIESIRIPDTGISVLQYSHESGALSDALSLTLSATVEAIAIDDRFACQVVFAQLSGQKPPDLILQTDTFTCERQPQIERLPDGRIVFTATGSAQAGIEPDIEMLKNMITGLSINDARQLLTEEIPAAPGQSPQVIISPQGFDRLPVLPVRIDIQVQQS